MVFLKIPNVLLRTVFTESHIVVESCDTRVILVRAYIVAYPPDDNDILSKM